MLRKNLVYSGRQVNFSVNECVLMCVVCWTCVVVCWHDADAAGLWMQWSTTGWRWKLVTLAAAATSALQWSDLLRFLPTSLLSTSWIGQHLTLHPHTHTLSLSLSLSLSLYHTHKFKDLMSADCNCNKFINKFLQNTGKWLCGTHTIRPLSH